MNDTARLQAHKKYVSTTIHSIKSSISNNIFQKYNITYSIQLKTYSMIYSTIYVYSIYVFETVIIEMTN